MGDKCTASAIVACIADFVTAVDDLLGQANFITVVSSRARQAHGDNRVAGSVRICANRARCGRVCSGEAIVACWAFASSDVAKLVVQRECLSKLSFGTEIACIAVTVWG